jgi:hypothetical protein
MVETLIAAAMIALAEAQATLRIVRSPDPAEALEAVAAAMRAAEELHLRACVERASDSGSTLSLLPGADRWRVVED